MSPTQSTVTAAPPGHPDRHSVSVPAMVVLALFLFLMAALALAVILRQRRAMAHFSRKTNPVRAPLVPSWSCLRSRSKPPPTSCDPPAVGALHAAGVLLAAAPCQVFSPPMTMHFRIPLQDKTVLILGAPCYPVRCEAQCCGAPARDCSEPCQQ